MIRLNRRKPWYVFSGTSATLGAMAGFFVAMAFFVTFLSFSSLRFVIPSGYSSNLVSAKTCTIVARCPGVVKVLCRVLTRF